MRKLSSLFALLLAVAASALADGTITTPVNNAPTTWKIAQAHFVNGSGGEANYIEIVVHQIAASGAIVQTNVITVTAAAELNSFLAQQETAVAGEPAGTTLANRAKRLRMRWTKWLIDNGKVTNFSAET